MQGYEGSGVEVRVVTGFCGIFAAVLGPVRAGEGCEGGDAEEL